MCWIEVLQALATPAIALLAAVIAWGQWQANRARLATDLYDRRFALFMEVRRLVSEVTAHGRVGDRGLSNEVLAQGRYLFGPEIQEDLEELHQLMGRLEMDDPKALVQINEKFKEIMLALEPYLRMPQKMPRWF